MTTKTSSTNEPKRGALDPLMTTTELADYLNMPVTQVHANYRKWDLPYTRIRRQLRWRIEEVDAWLDLRREIPRRWQQ